MGIFESRVSVWSEVSNVRRSFSETKAFQIIFPERTRRVKRKETDTQRKREGRKEGKSEREKERKKERKEERRKKIR